MPVSREHLRAAGEPRLVVRVTPKRIPSFADLKLPVQLAEIANLRNGVVLVTGPTGSGSQSGLLRGR